MRNEATDVLSMFQQGDLDAFESLFRMHQQLVYAWVLRIVRNRETAEELTVETFWRIYRARARFEPGRGFEGWARRIATHAALDWMRSRRAEVELNAELLDFRRPGLWAMRLSLRRFARRPRARFNGCRPNCALRRCSR